MMEIARATSPAAPSVFFVDSDHQQMKLSKFCVESLCWLCGTSPVSFYPDLDWQYKYPCEVAGIAKLTLIYCIKEVLT